MDLPFSLHDSASVRPTDAEVQELQSAFLPSLVRSLFVLHSTSGATATAAAIRIDSLNLGFQTPSTQTIFLFLSQLTGSVRTCFSLVLHLNRDVEDHCPQWPQSDYMLLWRATAANGASLPRTYLAFTAKQFVVCGIRGDGGGGCFVASPRWTDGRMGRGREREQFSSIVDSGESPSKCWPNSSSFCRRRRRRS